MTISDITYPKDRAFNSPNLEGVVDGGKPFASERRYIRRNGSVVWTNNSVARDLHLNRVEKWALIVQALVQRGFATRLIEKGLATEFLGRVEIMLGSKGLLLRLTAKLPESDV